jgi:hypothetical protein
MKAPKRIWLSRHMDWDDVQKQSDDDVDYVRADLVGDLVEGLEDMIKGGESMGWESAIKARAALKVLEEE